jgi:hypothetical protein
MYLRVMAATSVEETLNDSRESLAAQRARRQGALRSAVLTVQSSSATPAAGALCGPDGRLLAALWTALAFL